MGEIYVIDYNPVVGVILDTMISFEYQEKKPRKNYMRTAVMNECLSYFIDVLPNKDDLEFLDFDIKIDDKGDCAEIITNNTVTALWFLNIFPSNAQRVNNEKKYFQQGVGNYIYDEKTKTIKLV